MCRLVILYINFATGFCGVIITPENTAVVAGQRMSLECRTDNESTFESWSYINNSISFAQPENIATVGNMKLKHNPKFSQFGILFDQSGSNVLYTNSTNFKDAGIYTCQVKTGDEAIKYSAQVIVLRTEPFCSTNLSTFENGSLTEDDYIWMQCTVEFNGNWSPRMTWRKYFIDMEENHNGSVSVEGVERATNFSLTSDVIVKIDKQHRVSYFICETRFVSISVGSQEMATNIPNFTYTWWSPAVILAVPSAPKENTIFILSITLGSVVAFLFVFIVPLVCVYRISRQRLSTGESSRKESKRA